MPTLRAALCLSIGLLAGLPAAAQNNVCDLPGEEPDVIVGEIDEIERHGTNLGITSYSFSTWSCNIGTCWLNWFSDTAEHPVIAQNMFRLMDGRFEHIGQSWLKHGFFALSENLCSNGCLETDGTHLGVNCSDPYSAFLNGLQGGLGPKSEVNASRGIFAYPFSTQGQSGGVLYKRLQVHNVDLDPALNPGALYFVEGQYVTTDDAAGGNGHNNASHRPVSISVPTPGVYFPTLQGSITREQPAIRAWKAIDPGVVETIVDVANDGRYLLAVRVTEVSPGSWQYEYALHNLNSDRSGQSFSVPLPPGVSVTDPGFHDVDYHSGEPYDGTDWPASVGATQISWSTTPFATNPNANALRWGTLYNFRFRATKPPANGTATLGLFRTGAPASIALATLVPAACDVDGVCGAGETCDNCPADCVHGDPNGGVCGNALCEPAVGEDCLSCPADCRGVQGGSPSARFCCGDGAGQNPVGCADARCTTAGFSCTDALPGSCCGDFDCAAGETTCNCATDCGPPAAFELSCTDGADNDCDGLSDCPDLDCCFQPSCAGAPDPDGDGVRACDCDGADPEIWGRPGEVRDLRLGFDASLGTVLSWSPPSDLGGLSVLYEVLRSPSPASFGALATCVTVDSPDVTEPDPSMPPADSLFGYLVRATNGCPAGEGEGPLGTKSDGGPRTGRACP